MILNGKEVSSAVRAQVAMQVKEYRLKTGKVPHLAAVLVGDDPASQVYVTSKEKACLEAGMNSTVFRLSAETTEQEILDLIRQLNQDPEINGILVQLPLPGHIRETIVLETVSPWKDVDCFHPVNVGKLVIGQPVFLPATPAGVLEILKYYQIGTAGKHVVIAGRSNIVGKPITNMLLQKGTPGNATVTVVHSYTHDIEKFTQQADILIAAIGKPQFFRGNMIKKGAVVIDVGINRIPDSSTAKGYRLVGDVHFEEAVRIASAITPVPGGVGPMTIAMLLKNTLKAFEVQNGIQ